MHSSNTSIAYIYLSTVSFYNLKYVYNKNKPPLQCTGCTGHKQSVVIQAK